MERLIPTDDDYERAEAKFDERREERLAKHYDSIIDLGYQVKVPHGKGEVVGYELLQYSGVVTVKTKPAPGVSFRYMVKLSPGHTWASEAPFYCAFPNETHLLMGQF